jgi:hypothetical protein
LNGGGGVEACSVGGDVVDGVGGHAARVEDDVGHELAVEEGLDTEVEVGRRAGDGGTEVGMGVVEDDRRVVAIDLDNMRGRRGSIEGWRRR